MLELQDEVAELRAVTDELRAVLEQRRVELQAVRDVSTDHERARNDLDLRLHRVLTVELPAVTAELERHRQLVAEGGAHIDTAIRNRSRLEHANTELHRVNDELGRQLLAVRAELEGIKQSRSRKSLRMVSRSAQALTDPFRRS